MVGAHLIARWWYSWQPSVELNAVVYKRGCSCRRDMPLLINQLFLDQPQGKNTRHASLRKPQEQSLRNVFYLYPSLCLSIYLSISLSLYLSLQWLNCSDICLIAYPWEENIIFVHMSVKRQFDPRYWLECKNKSLRNWKIDQIMWFIMVIMILFRTWKKKKNCWCTFQAFCTLL